MRNNELTRLRELRKSRNLTLQELNKELAKRNVNISVGILSKYERGDRVPKDDNLIQLAKFFGVTTDYLQGYGYTKEYIYNVMLNACHDSSKYSPVVLARKNGNFDVSKAIDFINEMYKQKDPLSLKYKIYNEVLDYLGLHPEIDIPSIEEIQYDFWNNNFNFIFDRAPIKMLLTTKDNLEETEIFAILGDVLRLENLETETKIKADTLEKQKEMLNFDKYPAYLSISQYEIDFKKVIDDYFDSLDK